MIIRHENKTRLSIGSRVITPHGGGVIVAEEVFRTCERWGVKLDENPFSFPVAFYFKNEIRATKEITHINEKSW